MNNAALKIPARYPVLCAADGKILVDVPPSPPPAAAADRIDRPAPKRRLDPVSSAITHAGRQLHHMSSRRQSRAKPFVAALDPYHLIALAEKEARLGHDLQAQRLLEAVYAVFDGRSRR